MDKLLIVSKGSVCVWRMWSVLQMVGGVAWGLGIAQDWQRIGLIGFPPWESRHLTSVVHRETAGWQSDGTSVHDELRGTIIIYYYTPHTPGCACDT